MRKNNQILRHRMRPFQMDLNQAPPSYQEELESRRKQVLRQRMNSFWRQQFTEIRNNRDTKSVLPLARMRRLMKTNSDVKMVSADSPVLFGKACELFMLEITFRAWLVTAADRRQTVLRSDITKAIADRVPTFEFLHDIFKDDENETNQKEVETEVEARPALKRRPLLNLNE